MSATVANKPSVKDLFLTMDYGPVSEGKTLAEEWVRVNSEQFGVFLNGKLTQSSEGIQALRTGLNGTAMLKLNIKEDSAAAISAATNAFPKWSQLGCHIRAKILYNIARQLQKHITLITQVESLSRGVQVRDTRECDVPAIIRSFYYYAGWAQILDSDLQNWKPHGVVAGVTCSSSPLSSLAMIVAPALAAGNAVILLPQASSCMSAFLLAEICTAAGVSEGVLNVIPWENNPSECSVLMSDKVMKVAAIGPAQLGPSVLSCAIPQRLGYDVMVLNGCVPMIVLNSADIDAVVDCVMDAAWTNQGQDPWTLHLLIVQEAILDALRHKFKSRVSGLQMGGAFDKMADVSSSVVDSAIAERLQKTLMLDQGAEVIRPSGAEAGEWAPTIVFSTAPPSPPVLSAEEVCPIVHVVGVRSSKEAVTVANHSGAGLAASVWTESNADAWEVATQLKAGTVWVNSHGLIDASVPMGGRSSSGEGCVNGREGIMEYLQPRSTPLNKTAELNLATKTSLLPIGSVDNLDCIDQTYKLFYGGGHKRPDSNSYRTLFSTGKPIAVIPEAGRKDARNAVEAAAKAQPGWWKRGAHNRAQILYNLAEKLQGRHSHFAGHLKTLYKHDDLTKCNQEVDECIRVLFHWAAVCDKNVLQSGNCSLPGLTITTTREPCGVIAIVALNGAGNSLQDLVTLIGGAVAYGNTCIVAARPDCPTPALELAMLFESAEIPPSVINVLTGETDSLLTTLCGHMEVNAVWCIGYEHNYVTQMKKEASQSNMKRCWVQSSIADPASVTSRHMYEMQASHCKAVWMSTIASFGS